MNSICRNLQKSEEYRGPPLLPTPTIAYRGLPPSPRAKSAIWGSKKWPQISDSNPKSQIRTQNLRFKPQNLRFEPQNLRFEPKISESSPKISNSCPKSQIRIQQLRFKPKISDSSQKSEIRPPNLRYQHPPKSSEASSAEIQGAGGDREAFSIYYLIKTRLNIMFLVFFLVRFGPKSA